MAVGQLIEKYGTNSPVWKHFVLMTDESSGGIQPDSPVCRICGTQVRARTGNTSNYLLSLINKHSVVHKESRAQMNAAGSEKQSTKTGSQHRPTLFSVVSKTKPHDRNGRWWTELTDSITYWIAKMVCLSTWLKKVASRK